MDLTGCRQKVDIGARIEFRSFELERRLADGSIPDPGNVFAIVRVRHASHRDDSCHLDWDHVVAIDDRDRRYTPRQAWEGRGKSSSTGLFGTVHETNEPHELTVIYEIPADVRLTKVAVGQFVWLPERVASVIE